MVTPETTMEMETKEVTMETTLQENKMNTEMEMENELLPDIHQRMLVTYKFIKLHISTFWILVFWKLVWIL